MNQLSAGTRFAATSKIRGHRSIKVTQPYYADFKPEAPHDHIKLGFGDPDVEHAEGDENRPPVTH